MNGSVSVSRVAGESSFGRITLGNVAIFACLAGGAAAISSAGVAFPIKNVGFSGDWMSKALFVDASRKTEQVHSAKLAVKAAAPSASGRPKAPDDGLSLRATPLNPAQVVLVSTPVRLVQARPSALSLVTEMQTGVRDPFGIRRVTATDAVDAEALNPAVAVPAALVTPQISNVAPGLSSSVEVIDAAPLTSSHAPVALQQPGAAEPKLELIGGSEIAGFDLGKVRGSTPTSAAALAKPAAKAAIAAKPGASQPRDLSVGDAIFHQVGLSVGGSPAQAISVRIGSDMKPSIKVADLLSLVASQLDPDSAARFATAASAQDYVSLATLREAGFQVSYNAAADSIAISAAP